MAIRKITTSFIFLSFLFLAQGTSSSAQSCDKTCLYDMTETFLETKARNQPASLNLATNIRATYNSQIVEPGKGDSWIDGVAIVNRHSFVDPQTRTSIFFGTMVGPPVEEGERRWWHYALRLTLNEAGQILELEEHTNEKGFKLPSSLEVPFQESALFNAVLPEDERSSANEMVAAADAYWQGITIGNEENIPYGPDCQRTEFGGYSTNSPIKHNRFAQPDLEKEQVGKSCRKFHDSPNFRWTVENRRYYIVDEARGVVVGIGQLKKFKDDGIPGLTLTEAFKIVNGRIQFLWAPSFQWGKENSGWPDWSRK